MTDRYAAYGKLKLDRPAERILSLLPWESQRCYVAIG